MPGRNSWRKRTVNLFRAAKISKPIHTIFSVIIVAEMGPSYSTPGAPYGAGLYRFIKVPHPPRQKNPKRKILPSVLSQCSSPNVVAAPPVFCCWAANMKWLSASRLPLAQQ
jgi:hypothetical protein